MTKASDGEEENGEQYCGIPVNQIKVLEDADFKHIKELCDNNTGWNIAYDKRAVKVWTKSVPKSDLHMIKARATLSDVPASVFYDVLHDPNYRSSWDKYHIAAVDVGMINPNNDVCYYAVGGLPPLRARDFVLQRSWLDTGEEKYICSHSVCHEKYPPSKGYVRGTVYLTAYFIRDLGNKKGCQVTYVNHSDPKGKVPAWLTNRLTKVIGPRFIKRVHKACLNYEKWKQANHPNWKPWIYPEQQVDLVRVKLSDCEPQEYDDSDTTSSIVDEIETGSNNGNGSTSGDD